MVAVVYTVRRVAGGVQRAPHDVWRVAYGVRPGVNEITWTHDHLI